MMDVILKRAIKRYIVWQRKGNVIKKNNWRLIYCVSQVFDLVDKFRMAISNSLILAFLCYGLGISGATFYVSHSVGDS